MKRFDSLFVKTSLTLTFGLVLFILLSITFTWFFVLSPLSNRAAEDMAALIKMTSQTWSSLAVNERTAFKKRIALQHDLIFNEKHAIPTQELTKFYPFIPRLEKALKKHIGHNIVIKQDLEDDTFLWIELGLAKEKIQIGFEHGRPGPRPPIALTAIFGAATLLIIILTILLVRRITFPLKKMVNAVNQFGKGQFSTQISETGPAELVSLAHSFNQMAKEISQLMESRSIFFGGISHDLRTPITRMRLAVALLEQENNKDSALIASLKTDLVEMELLIQQALEFVKGLDRQHTEEINLDNAFCKIVEEYRTRDLFIRLKAEQIGVVKIEFGVFRRVLLNLLDNAFQYSGNRLVTLSYEKNGRHLIIRILDKGAGIPEEKLEKVFQPFYRLEHSRNKKTGGSGLGLAIVRQLCDAHGWTIKLTPRKGQGMEASLEIPLASK